MEAVVADRAIIVALDYPAAEPAMELVSALDPELCRLKIGKEMFTRLGPSFVEKLAARGFDIFLDLKFHDIPNTVAAACAAAADLGVWMINVHALGGRRMMEAASERLATSDSRPLLVAVTVLTSMGEDDVAEIGLSGTPADSVSRLARLAADSGMDGVVCSPQEAGLIRPQVGDGFILVTPGVRPKSAASDDQKRVMTPLDAITSGADYLVIGRPITAAPDPLRSLQAILSDISVAQIRC
jgi:orotidine-5'-phosphate decarboxylase